MSVIKNIINKIINTIVKIFLEIFIFDKKFRAKLKTRFAKKYLEKYILQATSDNSFETKNKDNKKYKKVIWQYWHQGEENAPELIKKCFESVKKNMPDYEVKVLNYETIKDYIELPKLYYDLVEAKKMSIAHFSDMLRLYLLDKYGGLWIDSTIFLSSKIPDEIINSDFFVFQKDPKEDNFEDKMSCYFIADKEAKSKHISFLKQILDLYWHDNDFVINYFMFEHISTMISLYTKDLAKEWNKMPYYSSEDTGILQKKLYCKFDNNEFEQIKNKTTVHKLSHKIIRECEYKDSYYEFIIN